MLQYFINNVSHNRTRGANTTSLDVTGYCLIRSGDGRTFLICNLSHCMTVLVFHSLTL